MRVVEAEYDDKKEDMILPSVGGYSTPFKIPLDWELPSKVERLF